MEADAEAIRAAILLDELDTRVGGSLNPLKASRSAGGGSPGGGSPPSGGAQPGGGGGRIIVEVKTLNALAVLQYSCSIRVMALHTGEMNARR